MNRPIRGTLRCINAAKRTDVLSRFVANDSVQMQLIYGETFDSNSEKV